MATNYDEFKGNDFPMLTWEEQKELVRNCLVHSAKLIDEKAKTATVVDSLGNEHSEVLNIRSAFDTLNDWQAKEDIFNEAFALALERANDENHGEKPLLFMLCGCSMSVLNAFRYNGKAHAHDDVMDYENSVMATRYDSPEYRTMKECSKAELFGYIESAKRAEIITMLDFFDMGYTTAETADMMDVSADTIEQYLSAVVNALAVKKAHESDFRTAQRILDTTKANRNRTAHKRAEKAIYDMVKGVYAERREESTAVRNWLNLSYIERINLFTTNREAFNRICQLAFK